MSANVTVYRLRADPLAQISGTDGAPNAQIAAAAAMAINPESGIVQQLNGAAATSAAVAVTTLAAGRFGQLLILICADTGGVTYTFGTGFKPSATVNPTNGKVIVITFVSDGTFFREVSRSAAV